MAKKKPKQHKKKHQTRADVSGISVSQQDRAHNRRVAKKAAPAQDITAETWRSERDGEEWCLRRCGFDAESVAYKCRTDRRCDWQGIVLSHVDWVTGRETWAHVEETHLGTPEALSRIERRTRAPGRALRGTCWECEHLPDRMQFSSDLLPARPGAIAPWEMCQGCAHSYVGELEDDDRSLLAAYAHREDLIRNHIRDKARRVIDRARRRRKT